MGVARPDDPRRDRDRLAGETVRVAAAVPALVDGADDGRGGLQQRNPAEQLGADLRMLLYLGVLVIGERGRFGEQLAAHADLADVMQQGRVANVALLVL